MYIAGAYVPQIYAYTYVYIHIHVQSGNTHTLHTQMNACTDVLIHICTERKHTYITPRNVQMFLKCIVCFFL